MNDRRALIGVLVRAYGPVLNTEQIACALGYRTVDALKKAIERGQIPFPVTRLAGRRGWFAHALDVAAWMEQAFPNLQNGGQAMT